MNNIKKLFLTLLLVLPTLAGASCTSIPDRLITDNGEADPCSCNGLGTLTISGNFGVNASGSFTEQLSMSVAADSITGGCVKITAEGSTISIDDNPNLKKVTMTDTGVTIDGNVIINGTLTVATNQTLLINGNLTVNGTTTLFVTSLGSMATLIVSGNINIDGNNSAYLLNEGVIESSTGSISITNTQNGTNLPIDNQGIIRTQAANQSITIDTFQNTAGFNATAYSLSNSGTIEALGTGSTISIKNGNRAGGGFFNPDNINNSGTICVTMSGTIIFEANTVTGSGSTINNTGTIQGTGGSTLIQFKNNSAASDYIESSNTLSADTIERCGNTGSENLSGTVSPMLGLWGTC